MAKRGRPVKTPEVVVAPSGLQVMRIEVPYVPRAWALEFHNSFEQELDLILHRRAGKTTAILNHHQRAAVDDQWEANRLKFLRPSLTFEQLKELVSPPGGRHYGHVMPTRVQAKAVAWDKLKYYAAGVPGGIANESELLFKYPNGSKVQLFGADDPDSMRGFAFSGLSFDEYSQQPSNIFSEVLSKALGDHLGYRIFAGTIKGKDQLYKRWKAAQTLKGYFSLWQDVARSLATESGITIQLLQQTMDEERQQVAQGLMSQEEFDQEWFLSLEAAIKGAFFAPQLAKARRDGRITNVPFEPDFPVFTAWDLGRTDDTAIWWYQNIGQEIRILDCFSISGGSIEEFYEDEFHPGSITREIIVRAKERGYRYGRHWLPHDAKAKTLAANGKSIVEQLARYLGIQTLAIVPSLSVEDGIQAARAVIDRCWFHEPLCEEGINALLHYKRKFDSKSDSFAIKPVHDWASHISDAFRMLAVAERRKMPAEPAAAPPVFLQTDKMTLDELWATRDETMSEYQRI